MRLLADLQISPRTVTFLRSLGHDVVRVTEILQPTASDQSIVAKALKDHRAVLTQDLDFTSIVALSGLTAPSIITLRLSAGSVEIVNAALEHALPSIEADIVSGTLVTIEDGRVRRRPLPVQ